MRKFPKWWPQNPYPPEIFPMTASDYAKAVPDENLRTAISGFLCGYGWRVASEEILRRLNERDNR